MNTGKYLVKGERKISKRISRHPTYQAIRQRALKSEVEAMDFRRQFQTAGQTITGLKSTVAERDAHITDLTLLLKAADGEKEVLESQIKAFEAELELAREETEVIVVEIQAEAGV